MNVVSLQRQFERIGAELKVETVEPVEPRWKLSRVQQMALNSGYALDIVEQKRTESYQLVVRAEELPRLEAVTMDSQPKQRHLLLMMRTVDEDGEPVGDPSRFLCGHDERHWFIATPRGNVSNVAQAMESLKPIGLVTRQRRVGVRRKHWNRRKNAAFLRQGEWFFLPEPNYQPPAQVAILHNEPLQRGFGSKPHTIEYLVRDGGEQVWVCRNYPHGISELRYRNLINSKPKLKALDWQPMRRNPRVMARGKVRHADHATIELPFWHEVQINREGTMDSSGRISWNIAFLD
ncbi:MAG: hypothetical protein OHK0029_25860 [Armatimonadaceae bacterium]